MRERSYSYKSQWNSVDHTCTQNSTPFTIRNRSGHIRPWSEHDPTTHETVSHPSHKRGRSSTFGGALCMEKHKLSWICYLLKTHFVRDFLQNSIGNSSKSTTCNAIYNEGTILELQGAMEFHRQLTHQHHLQPHVQCGNDLTNANHNGTLSTTYARKQLTPHLQCGTGPNMIRPWSEHAPTHTRPPRTRRTKEVDYRRSGMHFVWKTWAFVHLLSLRNAFPARLPPKLHRQLLHQHHLQCHLQWRNDPTVSKHNGIPPATRPPAPLATAFTMRERSYSYKLQWNFVDHTCSKKRWQSMYNAEPIRPYRPMIRTWSDHTRDRLAPVAQQR